VERYDKHKEATRLIGELKQMLALSDAQPRRKEQTVSSVVPFLNRVRTNAYNLHEALKSAWHCHCSSAHKAMLQLERRDHERESDFNVLFVLRRHEKQGSDTSKGKLVSFLNVIDDIEIGASKTNSYWVKIRKPKSYTPVLSGKFLLKSSRTR
jgi:hypothetical protein